MLHAHRLLALEPLDRVRHAPGPSSGDRRGLEDLPTRPRVFDVVWLSTREPQNAEVKPENEASSSHRETP